MNQLKIEYVDINKLKPSEYNPRKWDKKIIEDIKKSIETFGIVDPIICNQAAGRENIVIGGHLRLHTLKSLNYKEAPVVYIEIPDIKKEQELNIRLNKNLGEFDFELLANIDLDILKSVGFENWELGLEINKIDPMDEWKNMPEFIQNEIKPYKALIVYFINEEDYNKFAKLINQNITLDSKYIYYPKQDFNSLNRDKIIINE